MARMLGHPRKFSGFVIKNVDTKLYWCGKHTWVSTMTRARHFVNEVDAEAQIIVIRSQEKSPSMPLKVLNIGESL